MIRVRGLTLAEAIAAAPKRSTYLPPTRLDRAVYARHETWGAGFPLHEYGADGRCSVKGCDVYDKAEDDNSVGGDD